MTTISTIKPAGGGDFAGLVSWEDWSDDDPNGQGNAAYWAEMYKGNLGSNVLMDMTSPAPTAADHRNVFVAGGQEHDGRDPTTGAYIGTATPGEWGLVMLGENFVELRDLALQVPQHSAAIGCGSTEGAIIEGCLVEKTGGYIGGILVYPL